MLKFFKKLFHTTEIQHPEPVDYDNIKSIVANVFSEWSKKLPDSMCFTCKNMMKGYYIANQDHLFCSENCLSEFQRIRDTHNPSLVQKSIKGEPVKIIKPNQ